MKSRNMATYLYGVAMAISGSSAYYGIAKGESKLPLTKKQVKARNKNKRGKQARKKQRG